MFKGNIGNLMRQAQQMQDAMQKAQGELGTIEVLGESGGGLVKVTMSGKHEVRRVQIAAGAVGEDLIAAATNDAVGKVEAAVQAKYAGITAGMKLPPGMKMPF